MRRLSKKSFLIFAVVFAVCIALVACAPQTASQGSPDAQGESESVAPVEAEGSAEEASTSATQVSAEVGSECAACHAEEVASVADASMLIAGHASFSCADCHTDEAIGEIHAGVTAPPDDETLRALKKRGRTMGTSEFCLTCHGSLEELATKTADVTVVQDTTGTVTNPHALPTGQRHVEANVQECYNCHWLHRSSPGANSNCQSCHHAGVYECGTCHEMRD